MYCKECFFYQDEVVSVCTYCGGKEFIKDSEDHDRYVYLDITRFPFSNLIKTLKKSANPLLFLVVLPIIAIMYMAHKIIHKPFLFPYARTTKLRKKVVPIRASEKWFSPGLTKLLIFLKENNFAEILAYENRSLFSPVVNFLLVNKAKKHYASIEINKANARISLITFQIFSPQQFCLAVNNASGITINHPKYVKEFHFPEMTIKSLYEQFCDQARKYESQALDFSLKEYIPLVARLHEYSLDQAIKQKFLCLSQNPETFIPLQMCINHPTLAAVRTCTNCEAPLCEACFKAGKFTVQCFLCREQKPVHDHSDHSEQPLKVYTYAGLFHRFASTFLDFAGISIVAVSLWYIIAQITGVLLTDNLSFGIAVILTGIFSTALIIKTMVIDTIKYSSSPGQRILGLRIINQFGEPLSYPVLLTRYSLQFIAMVLIFPLFGYLSIWFHKKKQGFHDILTETSITLSDSQKNRMRTRFIVILVYFSIILGSVSGSVYLYQSFFTDSQKASIALKKKWDLTDQELAGGSFIFFPGSGHYLVQCGRTIQGYQGKNGSLLWEKKLPHNHWEFPAFLRNTIQTKNPPVLLFTNTPPYMVKSINSKTGDDLWQHQFQYKLNKIAWLGQDSVLALYNNKIIMVLTSQGALLGTMSLSPLGIINRIIVNQGLLVELKSSDHKKYAYISLKNDFTIEPLNFMGYRPLYSLNNGYHFLGNQNQTKLVYLPENREIWQRDLPVSYIRGQQKLANSSDNSLNLIIYANKVAFHSKDGDILFTYPENTRILAVTPNSLILSEVVYIERYKRTSEILIMCDKFTGKPIKKVTTPNYFRFYQVGCNDHNTYLGSIKHPNFSWMGKKEDFYLWQINHQSLATKTVFIGNNLDLFRASILSDDQSIFIANNTSQLVYSLP